VNKTILSRKLMIAVLAFGFGINGLAFAEEDTVETFEPMGFAAKQNVLLPLTPEEAFDVMTGDVLPWWDHHMSEEPVAMVIEPKPGGHFYELFNENGDGVIHATVTYVERGKKLRLEGPLGLAGRALQLVSTIDFAQDEGGTLVTVTVTMSGQITEDWAQAVENVWYHFLVEQLKPYVESKLEE